MTNRTKPKPVLFTVTTDGVTTDRIEYLVQPNIRRP